MVLSRLWRTWQSLRQLERKAPEVLRTVAARDAAAQALAAKRAQQSQEAMSALANTMSTRVQHAGVAQEEALRRRADALEKALESVQLDHTVVQERAVTSLLDNWESKLEKGGVPKPSSAKKVDNEKV
jgi:hypothetical protein